MSSAKPNFGIRILVAMFFIFGGQSASAETSEGSGIEAGVFLTTPKASPAVESAVSEPQQTEKADMVVTNNIDGAKYQTERDRINGRIVVLKDKGMGVRSFSNLVEQMDALYKRGDQKGVSTIMNDLNRDITELEARRREAQSIKAHSQSQVQMVSGGAKPSTAHRSEPYNGSMDGFVDQVLGSIITREVGRFVPQKGPFIVERFRIAQRMHSLEQRRMPIDGYANLFRQVEDLAGSRDQRRFGELTMNIRYLQQQLGLAQLEGSLHRDLRL